MFDKLFITVIIVLGLSLAAMFTYIQIQRVTISDQKQTILTTQNERDNAKAALTTEQLKVANSKAANDTLQDLLTKQKEESDRLSDNLQEIENAPETDNGDVSPVLRNSLERMRNHNVPQRSTDLHGSTTRLPKRM